MVAEAQGSGFRAPVKGPGGPHPAPAVENPFGEEHVSAGKGVGSSGFALRLESPSLLSFPGT